MDFYCTTKGVIIGLGYNKKENNFHLSLEYDLIITNLICTTQKNVFLWLGSNWIYEIWTEIK